MGFETGFKMVSHKGIAMSLYDPLLSMSFKYAEVTQEPFKYRHILHYRMIIQHNLRVKKSKHDMNRNPD